MADVKALIYLRISEDRAGLSAGVDRQREDCERRALDRGWEVVAEEADNDTSAYSGKRRRGFEAMLKAVESGAVQVVLAWSLDRLQRSRRDEVRLYELCQKHGVLLSLVNGADLDFPTAAGRFVADSLGSVARFEVELKSDRQKRAQLQAAQKGLRSGGRRPFGYEADGVKVRGVEAAAVRDGFAALLAGESLAGIARAWNGRGLVTGQGSPWRRDAVRVVLRNPRYAGLRAHKGEVVAAAVWPALVDEGTWRAAREILDHPERVRAPRAARYLLSGLAVCGVCGSPIHAGGAARRGVRAYRCGGSMGHFSRMADPVDEYVAAVVCGVLGRPDAAGLLVDESRPDVEELRVESVALRARLDSLAVDFADGVLTASQLRAATERLRARLAEVEGQMADASRVDVLGALVGAEDVRAAWDGLSVDRQRAVIDVLARVVVHPPGRGVRTFRPETVELQPRS